MVRGRGRVRRTRRDALACEHPTFELRGSSRLAWVTFIEHSVELDAELLVTREPNVLEVLRLIRVVIDAGLPDVLEAAYLLGGPLAVAQLMPAQIPRSKFGAFVDPNWGRK